MSGAASYGYAEGDLLAQPAVYSFARFGGAAFLEAWRTHRAGLLALHGAGASPDPASAPVDLLLEQLLQALRQPGDASSALQQLKNLLQRFEVTKRLHDAYNERWRPVDPSAWRGTERYLRFAEALEAAYARDAQLPWLNGLLKCMDTLSSLAASLDAAQVRRLQHLARSEAGHIASVAQRVGVST